MEELRLTYKEIVDEVYRLQIGVKSENTVVNAMEKVFQNLSIERDIPTTAKPVFPNWFTPVEQDVVTGLWNNNDPESSGLRMAAVKYLQEIALKYEQHLFIHDAIKLIKYVADRPIENI